MAQTVSEIIPRHQTVKLYEDKLPAIKNWKVGQNYEIHLKVRLVSLYEEGYEYGESDKKSPLCATFEVTKAMECDD
jgi:hypothetical protein